MKSAVSLNFANEKLSLDFSGELNLYSVTTLQNSIFHVNLQNIESIVINLKDVDFIDTAAGLFLVKLEEDYNAKNIRTTIVTQSSTVLSTLELVKLQKISTQIDTKVEKKRLLNFPHKVINDYFLGFFSFMEFFGKLMMTKISYMQSFKNIRFKEIAFEINESGIKALGIVALTSFLIGLVVAYQSAYQLKIYGANIFIVDMLGISILRELAPLITAIVIAGRSGSAFTAQIGAMKITQELDAMKTMGFDPYAFLVMPRIIALMIVLPILIFVADIMGILGGMIVSYIDLGITTNLFVDRFREVVDAKHFFIGILKGPFFAFLIASIGIYRGLVVKDDTQSIGFNTTKSVVESIFAVIVCDALFSIAFTNLGI
ncbi:MAG: MlaE family lipid ABC transporter permease subunit [Campylobacterota bacterium]|nr:MlaE family lipid ABC transporter permease subunit [Campylobacterota bacterium]